MESDGCYFRRRADEEFAAAKAARCDESRACHFELGERYSQLAAAIDAVNEQIGPTPRRVLIAGDRSEPRSAGGGLSSALSELPRDSIRDTP